MEYHSPIQYSWKESRGILGSLKSTSKSKSMLVAAVGGIGDLWGFQRRSGVWMGWQKRKMVWDWTHMPKSMAAMSHQYFHSVVSEVKGEEVLEEETEEEEDEEEEDWCKRR